MPSSNYDTSAYQEAGNNHWYLMQVDKDGSALATPDTFGHMEVKMTSILNDTTPSHDVLGDDKQPFTSIADPRTISLEFEVGQDDSVVQTRLQSALGKYWAVVNIVGVDSYDNTTSKNLMKIEYYPILKLDPTYVRATPDGRKPKYLFRPVKVAGTAITITNLGTITGALTTADADAGLDSTAWDALDITVAIGAYMNTATCVVA